MSLDSLGLTELEERVYRALLGDGETVAEGRQDAVDAALTRLAELELVRFDDSGRAAAVDPEVGIPRLIRRRLQEANAEVRRISGAWEALHTLTAEVRHEDTQYSMEKIEGADRVDERIWALAQDAGEVLAVHHKQRVARAGHMPRFLDRLSAGVEWRTIIPREHLNDPAVAEYCLQLHRAGDRHRVTDEAVQQMVILDRSIAFVPTVPNAHLSGALMIRQQGAVATLVDLFERVWTHAADIEPETPPHLTARDRQILHLLATVVKDEIAARELGVSLRTYRRYVADLLTRLNTANRVQAVVQAKQQGWI